MCLLNRIPLCICSTATQRGGDHECESVDICGKCVNKIIKSELINEANAREKARITHARDRAATALGSQRSGETKPTEAPKAWKIERRPGPAKIRFQFISLFALGCLNVVALSRVQAFEGESVHFCSGRFLYAFCSR